MRIVITGGGGFLGEAIVRQLLEEGHEVVSVARSDYPALRALGAETVRGDLVDRDVMRGALEGADALIHTAAKVGMWGSHEDFVRTNVEGTRALVALCRELGVERMVFTSSPSVTFDGGDAENEGQDTPYPAHYMASYPETKAMAEQIVLGANSPTFRTTSLRPHLIWGPGDPHLIPRLVERARAGKLKIVGDGKNKVDITYVENAARAHVDALTALDRADDEPNPRGKAYYISNGEPVVLWEWINGLLRELGISPVTSKVPFRAAYLAGGMMESAWKMLRKDGEPPMTKFVASQLATSHWYDMEPARRDLGYEPQVSMKEGLERLLESLKGA